MMWRDGTLNTRVATPGPVHIHLYHLSSVLYVEATDSILNMKMVLKGKCTGTDIWQEDGRVISLWQQYCVKNINASQLLKECATIYGPLAH